jgi:hypothetical protein
MGFIKKAVAEVDTPTTIMHPIAKLSLSHLSFINNNNRLCLSLI